MRPDDKLGKPKPMRLSGRSLLVHTCTPAVLAGSSPAKWHNAVSRSATLEGGVAHDLKYAAAMGRALLVALEASVAGMGPAFAEGPPYSVHGEALIATLLEFVEEESPASRGHRHAPGNVQVPGERQPRFAALASAELAHPEVHRQLPGIVRPRRRTFGGAGHSSTTSRRSAPSAEGVPTMVAAKTTGPAGVVRFNVLVRAVPAACGQRLVPRSESWGMLFWWRVQVPSG